MYVWQFAIGRTVIMGRTWSEFEYLIDQLAEAFDTNDKLHLIIYVHNLPYEFQFMCKHFLWKKVFSLEERKPVKAELLNGIEFRCSLKLSGYRLEKLSDQLTEYEVKKLVGDLDYTKLRHTKTPLTEEEIGYCVNDVLVVTAYITEYMHRVGSITKIPLTKTGAVRESTRKYCFYGGLQGRNQDIYKAYRKYISEIQLEPEHYQMCKQAFAGGFTHASHYYVGETLNDIHSMDFTSSYPYVMLSEQFPVTTPKKIEGVESEEELKPYLNKCCIMEVYFKNIRPRFDIDHYISKSKCTLLTNPVIDNGRVVQSVELVTTITEQDYQIISAAYEYDYMLVGSLYVMEKEYLPYHYVTAILDYYEKKTTLKGVVGKEVEYLVSKENVNSMYGMTVTDICRPEIVYNAGIWSKEEPDLEQAIHKYNTSKKRFLAYQWGVWVTAYARKNLWDGIFALGRDFVYADTDSVKFKNYEAHKEYFEHYNKGVVVKLQKAMQHHKIPFERCKPKNIKGEELLLGVWDYEGCYEKFKTLGAKRYMVKKDGKVNITVAGLSKQNCVPYLIEKYGDNVFDAFADELYIPPAYTGKLTHTYIDEEMKGSLIDYTGVEAEYEELSGIHLGACDYNLSLSTEYIEYLLSGAWDIYE